MLKLQTDLCCACAWSQLKTTSQSELFEDVLASRAGLYKIVWLCFCWVVQEALVSEFLEGVQLKMNEALF